MTVNLHKFGCRYQTVTSTNDILRQKAHEGIPSGYVLTAERQTRGKGCHGREWYSGDMDNIYCSILLKNALSEKESGILPIATALGIVRVLRLEMDQDVWIKWPNDIIICEKKICGILAEYYEFMGEKNLIIGFGLNVNQQFFPEKLAGKASSLYILAGHKFDASVLLKRILTELEPIYENCIHDKNLSRYRQEIDHLLIRRGSMVYLKKGRKLQKAILNGINDDGSINFTADTGTFDNYSGEISLRGKESYI